VGEFDELIARPGVFMAGRIGADGSVAEHESKGLYTENLVAGGMARWFCAAITTMLGSMAFAIDSVNQGGLNQSSWLPVRSWSYTGGDYTIAVRGDRFVIAERAKIESIDELSRLLSAEGP